MQTIAPGPISEVRILDIFAILLRRWKTIVFSALAAVALAAGLLLLRPDSYEARTVLVPSAERGSGAGLRAELMAQMPMALPVGGAGGGDAKQKLVEVILTSRSIADSMVARIAAEPGPGSADESTIRRVLGRGVDVDASTVTGSIAITVAAPDPELAARIANTYPSLVNSIASSLAAQLAQRKEQFLEGQLSAAAERLTASEEKLVGFEKGRDAVDLQEQAKRTVEAASRLQQAITQQELKVAAIRRTATPNNPQLQAAEADLAARRQQLRQLMAGSQGNGELFVPLSESSDLKVAAARVLRDYARDEQIYKSLTASLTQARMDASDNLPIVGVLDAASAPTEPATGHRLMILGIAGVAGLLAGLLIAFVGEYLRRMRVDPASDAFFSAWSEVRGGRTARSNGSARRVHVRSSHGES